MPENIDAILAAIDSNKSIRSAVINRLTTAYAAEFVNPLRAEIGGNDDISLDSVNSNKEWQE
ncbi:MULTISPECIES: hypothetical protein [unclassified Streptomyces]|uniref:hypothetical protein n=1 Tax=unclassified Streptomyces TaxID=2593676 RepID=UPI0033B53AE2